MKKQVPKREFASVMVLMLVAFLIRVIGYNWGAGDIWHPDEAQMVESAMDLAKEYSFDNYNLMYPAFFSQKILCIIFKILNFDELRCYYVGRLYVAGLSTLIVGVVYLTGRKVSKTAAWTMAVLCTIFKFFNIHSHYATIDIPLTLMFALVLYFALCYFEKKNTWNLFFMSLFASIGFAEKFTGGYLCVVIAITVIYKEYLDTGKIMNKTVLLQGIKAVGFVFGSMLVLNPEMFHIREIMDMLSYQSSYSGSEYSPGFYDNLIYYMNQYYTGVGIILTVMTFLGIIINRKCWFERYMIIVLVFFLSLLCVMNRHYLRWGLPAFLIMIILTGKGMDGIVNRIFQRYSLKKLLIGTVILALGSNLSNIVIDNLAFIRSEQDTRVISKKFFEENDITRENSRWDGYTTLVPGSGTKAEKYLCIDDGKLYKTADFRIIVLGSHVQNRYLKELKKNEEALYKMRILKEECNQIYEIYSVYEDQFESAPKETVEAIEVVNLYWNIKRISEICKGLYIGQNIMIYDVSKLPVYESAVR